MSNELIDPSAIDGAPITIDQNNDGIINADEKMAEQIGVLTDELANARAEVDRLQSESNIDRVKARMLEPYVNKVFEFVAFYCGFVAIVLFLCGMGAGFKLPETILAIISGSTAVSVIGLIGLVITGLFGGKKG